tara:strand:- start:166 stop:336 length:171 start_codon:yes stop_codon:yes gene_type:complete
MNRSSENDESPPQRKGKAQRRMPSAKHEKTTKAGSQRNNEEIKAPEREQPTNKSKT